MRLKRHVFVLTLSLLTEDSEQYGGTPSNQNLFSVYIANFKRVIGSYLGSECIQKFKVDELCKQELLERVSSNGYPTAYTQVYGE